VGSGGWSSGKEGWKRGRKIVYDNKTFLFSLENVVGWFLVEMFSGGLDGEGGEGFEKYGLNIYPGISFAKEIINKKWIILKPWMNLNYLQTVNLEVKMVC
jgi:hypothetical protein